MASSSFRVLTINPCQSDGVATNRPTRQLDPCDDYFLVQLAKKWAVDRPDIQLGTPVKLDKLPDGYAGFSYTRAGNKQHVDRYMYGHPNGYFDSTTKFYVHFRHLMTNGNANGCQCIKCAPGHGRVPQPVRASVGPSVVTSAASLLGSTVHSSAATSTSTASGPSGRRPEQPHRGTSKLALAAEPLLNPFAKLMEVYLDLGQDRNLDQALDSSYSSWPFKRHTAASFFRLHGISSRPGEIVLFQKGNSTERQSKQVQAGQTASEAVECWAAGLVIDILQNNSTVEPDCTVIRELTKVGIGLQHTVRPAQIMPLRQSAELLQAPQGIVPSDLSEAVLHASGAAGVSVASPYHLRAATVDGQVQGTIYCRGLFIGHELIVLGDMVRLREDLLEASPMPELLRLSKIKLRLINFNRTRCQVCIHIVGKPYTCNLALLPELKNEHKSTLSSIVPIAAGKLIIVPFTRILCRYRTSCPQGLRSGHQTMSPGSSAYDRANLEWFDSRLAQLNLTEESLR